MRISLILFPVILTAASSAHADTENPIQRLSCLAQAAPYAYSTYNVTLADLPAAGYVLRNDSGNVGNPDPEANVTNYQERGIVVAQGETPESVSVQLKFRDFNGESALHVSVDLASGTVERVHSPLCHHAGCRTYVQRSHMSGVATDASGETRPLQCSAVRRDDQRW